MNNTKNWESLIQLFFKKLFDERYGKAQQMNSALAMAWNGLNCAVVTEFSQLCGIFNSIKERRENLQSTLYLVKKKLSIDVIFVQLLKTIDKK